MMELNDEILESVAMALLVWIRSVEEKGIKIDGKVKRLRDLTPEEAQRVRNILTSKAIREVMNAQEEVPEGGSGGANKTGV